ncbi:hypothetical protein CWI38_0162p0060 [Hamiltosporidium tvaerminnensis]|uniref:Uncharacterized protein n=1 Tax=Hamiltosporidium tvaerminnensis TaxID=1176355 RepID=A0A4Q9M1H1_9MICR|nr:hypothetical protein CWI38_0162p0060 [Hamiltosporidium tvaerminnensis]
MFKNDFLFECVTKVVQVEVERRGLLAEKQLGAVIGVQKAKEQALLCIVLNKEYENNLKATWIHNVEREILQGDSLSPFVCVVFSHHHHLLLLDHLKLFAKDSQTLEEMIRNKKRKSAIIDPCFEDTATPLEGIGVYKYIEIIEDSREILTRNSFDELDVAVRAVLMNNKIHHRSGCKESLYLPRIEIGRGFHSVKNNNKTHLPLIKSFLKKNLEEAQLAKLYNEIGKINFTESANKAVFCYIQERNVFWNAEDAYQHCNQSRKRVYHLAARCEKMLGRDYTRLHHKVFKSSNGSNSTGEGIIENEDAEIRVDIRIKTYLKILNNRPDIFILDMKKNKITIIDARFTSNITLKKTANTPNVEIYIQSISIPNAEESREERQLVFLLIWNTSETTLLFKRVDFEQYVVRHINEDSNLEEERVDVQEVEKKT